jgi:hypothetical protein
MKRLGKAKRLDLDQLPKYYELIDKLSKQAVKGGSYYFDELGKFLGNVGSDSNVRIVTEEEWGYAQCYQVNGQGVLFSECTNIATLTMILTSFLPSGSYNSTGTSDEAMAGYNPYPNGQVQFVFDHDDPMWNDYFNMLSTMEHESNHYYLEHTTPGLTPEEIAQNECTTIIHQIVVNPTYQRTTQEYKTRTAEYLYKQWQILGKNGDIGHKIKDTRAICGL